MLELPEASVLARQLNETIPGKTVSHVAANQSPHKFAWFTGDPKKYHELLSGHSVGRSMAYGGLLEIEIGGRALLLGDGVTVRFHGAGEPRPAKHQLLIEFDDSTALSGSVQMYGGLWCFPTGQNDNPYYLTAKAKPSPLSDAFNKAYFDRVFRETPDKYSVKALMATEQRIPGLGNGVLQDILYNARLHPKRKISTLGEQEVVALFQAAKSTLKEMTEKGGRDTEKDLFGSPGGYRTLLSKNTVGTPCELCGTLIKKEAYMGGSIYVCEGCQH